MNQKVDIYIKEIKVFENGHYTKDRSAKNVMVAVWKQPSYSINEISAAASMKLKDADPSKKDAPGQSFPKSLKWRLFKTEVEGDSEINFVITGTVEISKVVQWFAKKLAEYLKSSVGAIPIIGSEITGLLKGLDDKTTKIAKGSLKVPKSGLKAGEYVIKLKAPEDLWVIVNTGRKRTGSKIDERVREQKVKKGESNGVMALDVIVS